MTARDEQKLDHSERKVTDCPQEEKKRRKTLQESNGVINYDCGCWNLWLKVYTKPVMAPLRFQWLSWPHSF